MNPFLEIVRTAREHSWCTKPGCTTCGACEYREALAKLSGPLGGGLVNAGLSAALAGHVDGGVYVCQVVQATGL